MSLFDTIKGVFHGSDTVAAGAQILNEARLLIDKVPADQLANELATRLPSVVTTRAGGQSKIFLIAYHAGELIRLLFSLRKQPGVANESGNQ